MLYIDMFMHCSIHWSLVMSCFSSHATWLYKDEWILTYLFIHCTEGTNDQVNQLRSPAEWGPQVFKQLLNKSQACSAGRPAIDGEGIAEVAWNVKAHLVGATCGICKFTSVQQSNSHMEFSFHSIYISILTDSTGCCRMAFPINQQRFGILLTWEKWHILHYLTQCSLCLVNLCSKDLSRADGLAISRLKLFEHRTCDLWTGRTPSYNLNWIRDFNHLIHPGLKVSRRAASLPTLKQRVQRLLKRNLHSYKRTQRESGPLRIESQVSRPKFSEDLWIKTWFLARFRA